LRRDWQRIHWLYAMGVRISVSSAEMAMHDHR
jgi:hypothetical protein